MHNLFQSSEVTVIIPTMALTERSEMLKRAIQSVRDSSKQSIAIIAVVNGNKYDDELCSWLSNQHDVKVEKNSVPSAPNAVLRGRELVQTKYFSTLDDDDEYLADSTDRKINALNHSETADLVITNYYQCMSGVNELRYATLKDVIADPFQALMNFNWLHNNNALYRTSSIDTNYFKNYSKYAEWTWLAFKLMMDNKQLIVIDEPLARCHGDTPNSLSKSNAYMEAYIPLFKQMLATSPPRTIQTAIARKMSAAYHCTAETAWADGRKLYAWKNHLLSLMQNGGYRYISYSRHLIG